CVIYYFFFQAEDGIRDRNVTGVQTCALPILLSITVKMYERPIISPKMNVNTTIPMTFRRWAELAFSVLIVNSETVLLHAEKVSRSEERRVGKERNVRRGTYVKRRKMKR